MKKGIVICTHKDSTEQFNNCIESLIVPNNKYSIYYVVNGFTDRCRYGNLIITGSDTFELGAISEAINEFKLDEFILLQDSIEIKNIELFDICFNEHEGKSVYFFNDFFCYAGKYRKEILDKLIPLPIITTKLDSIIQENDFNKKYLEMENESINLFSLVDTNIFEEKFGRKNMIIENNFLKKYKGTWNWEMIK
jgi:hypothetical protein